MKILLLMEGVDFGENSDIKEMEELTEKINEEN